MNQPQTAQSGQGMLKTAYTGKIAGMNQDMPMMAALRSKVNSLKTK